MRTALVRLALALTAFAAAPDALAQYPFDGGNPPLRLYAGQDIFTEPDAVDLAIATDGTQFIAYSFRGDLSNNHEVHVMRSTDGGDTWETWDVFRDFAGNDDFQNPRVEIIGRGTAAEEVVVAYDFRVSGRLGVEVARANPADASPSWSIERAIDVVNPAGAYPQFQGFDIAVGGDGQTVVGIAAVLEQEFNVFEYYYNVALNPGIGYGVQQLVHTIDADDAYWDVSADVGIAFHDAGGDKHVTMVLSLGGNDTGLPDFGEVRITHDVDWGLFGTFDPVTTVATRTWTIREVDLAADPDTDDLVFVSNTGPEFFGSEDGGATWSLVTLPNGDLPRAPVVRFDSGTFAVSGELPSTDEIVDYRPVASILGTWTGRAIHQLGDYLSHPIGVADDPSRPGETAVAVISDYAYIGYDGIWYNGTWRDDPGYGVLEQRTPQDAAGVIDSAPAVGDLDGDGIREIVTTSYDDFDDVSAVEIFAYDEALGSPLTYEMQGTSASSAPALGDVDDDGDLEVFVGTTRGGVHGLDHALNRLSGWPVVFPGQGNTWVSVGAVTGYARAEVVAAHRESVHLLNHAGLERTGWPYTAPSGTAVGRAALGDVDGDGTVEVVAAFTSGVVILNDDGTVQRLLQGPWVPSAGVSLADLDGDGDLEIAGPMEDGMVLLVHHDGTFYDPAFPFDAGMSAPVSQIAIADLVNVGEPVLCFTAGDRVYAIEPDGTAVAGYPVSPPHVAQTMTEPVIARVARPNTDRPQVVVGTDTGYAHVFTATGTSPRDWPHAVHTDPTQPVAMSDVDDDGITELVIAAGDNLYVLDMGVEGLPNPSRRWAQAGHDNRRSGCADCAPRNPTSVESPASTGAGVVDFRGASPNPASSSSTFAFSLAAPTPVSLQVFDARGRLVRELVAEDLPAGAHQISWNTTDTRGRAVSSGTYFARLATGTEAVVRRVSVVR